ncbi:MAG TPA: LysE family translocator [Puia sp.]|jgi:threonine/homoserine/homoserine lactone efflux protein|nr:LysE family translocator [Puia sp.]
MFSGITNYGLFLGAAFLICISPGPDMVYIIANGIYKGVRGGVVSALGMATGMVFHTILVTTGLALIIALPGILIGIKIAGALYLLWIGYSTLRDTHVTVDVGRPAGGYLGNIYTRAVITNVLNPKVAIFYLSFLPQFIAPDGKNARMGLVVLGVSFLIMGLLVDSAVGFLSGKVRHLLSSNAGIAKTLNLVSGIIFCALGILQVVSLLTAI